MRTIEFLPASRRVFRSPLEFHMMNSDALGCRRGWAGFQKTPHAHFTSLTRQRLVSRQDVRLDLAARLRYAAVRLRVVRLDRKARLDFRSRRRPVANLCRTLAMRV
jgi:hypothetical protein